MRPSLSLVAALAAIAVAGFVAVRSATDDPAPVAAARPAAAPAAQPARPVAGAASAAERAVPESREAIQLSFAPIVKRVAPAVVNVYATSRVTVRSPFDGDPFFERFFGGGSPRGTSRASARRSAPASSSIRLASSSPTTMSSTAPAR